MFVEEIEDCINALIELSPSDLFIKYDSCFDKLMMCEIYNTVQERIRHKSLSHEHEHLVLHQVSL